MKKFISGSTIVIIIISIVFGFLSGILGYSTAGLGGFSLPFFGRVNFNDQNLNNRQVVIDQPRNVIVDQNFQMKQIENNTLPTLVNIYSPRVSKNQAYTQAEITGQGTVLTADGWIVTSISAVDDLKAKYPAVGYESKQYELGSLVIDKNNGMVFGQLVGAKNLSVASWGDDKDLTIGQTLALIYGRHNLVVCHIKKIGYNFNSSADLVQSSDVIGKRIFLDVPLGPETNGGVVANLKGEIVGMVSGGSVVLVDSFKGAINKVLNNQPIVHASMGIKYIDLAQVEGLINLGYKGALVNENPVKGSATLGKLKVGDIIKKIDDVELGVYQDLSQIIAGYKPGEQIELLYSRNGQDAKVTITLQ